MSNRTKAALRCVLCLALGAALVLGALFLKRFVRINVADRPVARVDTSRLNDTDWDTARRQIAFLDHAVVNGTVVVLPGGSQVIDRTIVIPRGYTVQIPEGARYTLAAGVSIVSFSPVLADGGVSGIVMRGENAESAFGVIAIVDSDAPSLFRKVTIEHGSQAYVDGTLLTGAVSFIQSTTDIQSSNFMSNQGEDALNIRNATTTIQNAVFANNARDGLDLDAAVASIADTRFERNGLDGLDIGSSTVRLSGNQFVGHKRCLEIGEASAVSWERNSFTDCEVKFTLDGDSHILQGADEL